MFVPNQEMNIANTFTVYKLMKKSISYMFRKYMFGSICLFSDFFAKLTMFCQIKK